jgi:hypothetical protein
MLCNWLMLRKTGYGAGKNNTYHMRSDASKASDRYSFYTSKFSAINSLQ